jgi:polysaccharide deacetylase 2 family uncharacterized protein YibQ
VAADSGETLDPSVLPPRQESFLANYSRNFKLGTITFILAITVLPWTLNRFITHSQIEAASHKQKSAHPAHIEGADKERIHSQQTDGTPANGISGPAMALNDQDDKTIKLTPAPDPALSDDTAQGSLPRISEDGRQPWQVYARPYNTADKRPRIALVIADLGLSRVTSDAAINRLPANVTLAFDVQSPVAAAWSTRARQDGHEVIISIPMEPFDYPRSDPGPNTLLTSLPNSDNIQRILWALRQCIGYVGITTFSGSRFTTDPEKIRPLLDIVKQRGLMIFDARTAPHSVVTDMAKDAHIPTATETLQLDDGLSAVAIDKALERLENEARLNGHAVGVATSSPLILEHLQIWLKGLPDRGISLAPLSAMAN